MYSQASLQSLLTSIFSEMGSHYVVQTDLELTILLPQPTDVGMISVYIHVQLLSPAANQS